MNRRIPEASALRAFFEEQWKHIRHLLDAHQASRLDRLTQTERLSSAIETVVAGTDGRLRVIGNYRKRLRRSVRGLLDYMEDLVSDMPPSVVIRQSTFASNPLVNAFFVNTETMHQLFRQNREIQGFFNHKENQHRQEVFALLFLNRKEKNILGSEVQGGMILKEVLQTSVNFTDHRLTTPRATEETLRDELKKILFETIVQHLRAEIIRLRHGQTDEEKTAAMHNPQINLNNPEVYMAMLVDQLNYPQQLIKLDENLLSVSKMGIKLPSESTIPSNRFRFHEIEIKGKQARIVALVRYPRNEFEPHLHNSASDI